MTADMRAEAARRFSSAADSLVDACRLLEQCGMEDEPVEGLLQALERVTQQVHQMHPPEERYKFEAAEVIVPACRTAAYRQGNSDNTCGT